MDIRRSLTTAVAALMTIGCAGSSTIDENVADEEPRVLQGRFAAEPVVEPLVADEAYIGDRDFFVRYEGADGTVYARGNWSERIDLHAVAATAGDTYAGPYILPIQQRQKVRWAPLPEAPIAPRILRSDQWVRFMDGLMTSVLPDDGESGVAMHFDNDDYFLFINEVGRLESHLLTEKPAGYRIAQSISFGDFIRQGLPELRKFLVAEGITETRIVFNTGDMGAYSLPFIYVNIDLPVAVFVRYADEPPKSQGDKSVQVAQSAGHLLQSHTAGLAVRPVSSLYRLLFATGHAAVETVRPTWLVALEEQPIPELNKGPPMNLVDWEERLDRIAGGGASAGTIRYLMDGEEYFTRLVDALSNAQESIHIRTYIFDNDDYAERIGELLKRRAADGLKVKVLLDGLGTILATGAEDDSLPEEHVPTASVRAFLEDDSDVDVRQAKNPWLTGDHVKTTIIDNRFAFTGGMNIGREYRYTWHDLMMEVHGPVVDIFRNEFSDAWAHAGAFGDAGYLFSKLLPAPDLTEENGYPVRVLFTRPGDAQIFRAQLAAIRTAQSYIWIENAYFTDDAMLYELARARKRGVDVRVILPLVGNHGPINKSNALAANAMLEHGIRVFVYPGMSHVKAAVFDGWACLGSANWDKLSLRINKELNLATSYAPAVEELEQRLFEVDFARSVELTDPFPERWSDHLAEIMADYLL